MPSEYGRRALGGCRTATNGYAPGSGEGAHEALTFVLQEAAMKRIVSSFVIALSLVAVAEGCSSSGVDVPAISADEACTQLAATYCGKLDTCTTFYAALAFGDVATCKARFKDQCVRGLGAPSTASTPAKIASCAAKATSVTCSDLFADNLPTECRPIAGGLADGVACGDDSQCKSAFCGFDEDTATCGTCVAPPAAEAACANGDCPNGLKCGGDGKCHKPGAAGDACDDQRECNATLVCFNGQCAAPLAIGADCDPAGTATPTKPACDLVNGAWCNLKSKKCEAITRNAAVGASCGLDLTGGGLTVCEAKAYCNITNGTTFAGTCATRVADGATCDPAAKTLGDQCLSPAKCIGNVCKIADASLCK